MKHFGTVQSFNETTGHGFIRPEEGGKDLRFERCEILWDPMVSPRPGVRLSYRLGGRNGSASAIDLETVLSPQKVPAKSFSVFRTAAEESATRAEQDAWDNEGGHMSSTRGLIVSTPDAKLPYKVILKHEGLPDTECYFATMRECEAFVRRNTPKPLPYSSLSDQEPCAS